MFVGPPLRMGNSNLLPMFRPNCEGFFIKAILFKNIF